MPTGRRRSRENRKGSLRLFGKEVFSANSENEREEDWSEEKLHATDRPSETEYRKRRLFSLVGFAWRWMTRLSFLVNV